jgi:hypothetical protein
LTIRVDPGPYGSVRIAPAECRQNREGSVTCAAPWSPMAPDPPADYDPRHGGGAVRVQGERGPQVLDGPLRSLRHPDRRQAARRLPVTHGPWRATLTHQNGQRVNAPGPSTACEGASAASTTSVTCEFAATAAFHLALCTRPSFPGSHVRPGQAKYRCELPGSHGVWIETWTRPAPGSGPGGLCQWRCLS